MASSAEADELTEAHRLAQRQVSLGLVRDLLAVWPLLDVDDLDGSFGEWVAAVLAVVSAGRATSVRVTSNYLTSFRALELPGVAPIRVPAPSPLNRAAVRTSLRVTGPATAKRSIARGVPADRAMEVARLRTVAASQRHALDGGRRVLVDAINADERALGHARKTSGSPCHFCALLASRGPVYKSDETADFKPHDGCSCQPEPVYRRDAGWPVGAEQYRDLYEEAKRAARESDEDITATVMFRRLMEGRG